MFRFPFRLPVRVVALVGLAAAIVLAPTQGQAQEKKKKPQRDLVTRDEILDSGQSESDLFTVLRNVRPRFLEPPTGIRTLGNAVQTPTAVIIDGKPMGGIETLQAIVASTVDEVRYLEPSRAGTEYGPVAGGGAVVVKVYKPKGKPKVTVTDSMPTRTP